MRSQSGRRWRVGREGMPVLTVVPEDNGSEDGQAARPSLIDEIVREGARRMLAAALEAEVDAYIAELTGERDDRGRRLVVRDGHAQLRQVMTAAGAVEVTAPAGQRPQGRPAGRGSGSPRRSCRRGIATPRRSPRCCHCSTCTACPRATSCPRWSSSSVRVPACPRPARAATAGWRR
ncbi:hypothetical protein FAIPA1_420026 [Frankia sp. AiPs1]